MLENIYINNVALIKEESVDFTEGLNIISGETGSGKSMFIRAINFLLGQKAGKDFIRKDTDKAMVMGLFSVDNIELINNLEENDIYLDEDNKLSISRVVNQKGTSTIKINNRPVTVTFLKELVNNLVNIHTQHEYQNLLSKKEHINILDGILENKFKDIKVDYKNKYTELKILEKKLINFKKNQMEIAREKELLSFQISEIEDMKIKENEEEELTNRYNTLSRAESISISVEKSLTQLYRGYDDDISAYDKISLAINEFENIVSIDVSQEDVLKKLIDVQSNIEDIAQSISTYSDLLTYDEKELNEISTRISEIQNLKRKYGETEKEILDYLVSLKFKYEEIENLISNIGSLKKDFILKRDECYKLSNEITAIRSDGSKLLEKSITHILQDLGMKDVQFKVNILQKEKIDNTGRDDISFLISTNKGQELNNLDSIASGGEMARIMIAIKVIISEFDKIDTFIFDEIDSGVSGITAQKVGEKLSIIGRNHQIISITHLPQIAALADNHLLISKSSLEMETITNIKSLKENEKIEEICRLIGGGKHTNTTFLAAKEMIDYGDVFKNNL